jgi:hypothetical protein
MLGSQQYFVGQGNIDNQGNASIAQSYFMLEKEEEDPFNKFWDAVEGLVQRISGPVAFTTAPITPQGIFK